MFWRKDDQNEMVPQPAEILAEEEILPDGVDRAEYEEEYWYEENSPDYVEKRTLFEMHRRLPAEQLVFELETADLLHFAIGDRLLDCKIYPFLKQIPEILELFDLCTEEITIALYADERLASFTDTESAYESNNNFTLTMTGTRESSCGFRLRCVFEIVPE